MTVSDAPNCSVTYNRHYDNRNSFIIQATDAQDKMWENDFFVIKLPQKFVPSSAKIFLR
jgi:hypothetical protein